MRLLVVEDNEQLRAALVNGLRSVGYAVEEAADGLSGWEFASEARHDLIVLDRMLPGLDGLDLLRRLRLANSTVPVLLLTARDAVEDRVAGLDAGADDYLPKPFAVTELLARIRALLRRGRHLADPVVVLADLEVDTVSHTVKRAGKRLDLTPREYLILEFLISRGEAVVSRGELFDALYGKDQDNSMDAASNVIDVLVGRLRRKLHVPGTTALLHTRRGFGYQLSVEDA